MRMLFHAQLPQKNLVRFLINLSTNFLSKQNQNLQNFANVTYRLNAQKIGLEIGNQALESVKAYKLFDNQI